jgi:hypothetical protein
MGGLPTKYILQHPENILFVNETGSMQTKKTTVMLQVSFTASLVLMI